MSEGNVYVNINYADIARGVEAALGPITRAVNNLEDEVERTNGRLDALKKEVDDMRREQRFAAALQRAITEIIRVRQELDDKFGTHKLVRENMLGILDASDLSLIHESTISRCTEELMISAPKYWLAPCLIALAAWISNNESLAKRAIVEAVKRDDEKTSLLFALVCRRAQRTDTCFEWLGRYFAMQDPKKMKKSIIAYIDAYSNGVFGEDKDNVCVEHINHWMDMLKKNNPNFTQEQEAYWEAYFARITAGNPSLGGDYDVLKALSPEAGRMETYVSRIVAVDRAQGIRASFNDILLAQVDPEELVNEIDKQLRKLVEGYEEDEAPLRKEERFFTVVKETRGNEDLANKLIADEERRRFDPPVDFAKRLSDSITVRGEREDMQAISAKKTAVKLLKGYIQPAYERFVTEKKEVYPEEITLKLQEGGVKVRKVQGSAFAWSGKTKNAENREALKNDVAKNYDDAKSASVAMVTNKNVITAGVFAGIFAALAILFFILGGTTDFGAVGVVFGIFALIGAILFLLIGVVGGMKKNKQDKAALANYYDEAKDKKLKLLDIALNARVRINAMVADFEGNVNSTKLFEEDFVEAPAAIEEAAEEVAPEVAEEAAPEATESVEAETEQEEEENE